MTPPEPARLDAPVHVARTTLLCVARPGPENGIRTLLTAFGLLADDRPWADLEIIGAGSLSGELVAEARALGLEDRVRFRGPLPSPEVHHALKRCAALVVPCPANGRDESSAVVLEAMACGTPVFATAGDDATELAVAIDSLLEARLPRRQRCQVAVHRPTGTAVRPALPRRGGAGRRTFVGLAHCTFRMSQLRSRETADGPGTVAERLGRRRVDPRRPEDGMT
jgi:Glycosyl transferases group 1